MGLDDVVSIRSVVRRRARRVYLERAKGGRRVAAGEEARPLEWRALAHTLLAL